MLGRKYNNLCQIDDITGKGTTSQAVDFDLHKEKLSGADWLPTTKTSLIVTSYKLYEFIFCPISFSVNLNL
ncbi:hypothetical protein FDUTEX481_05934 [Tolypothrix sp. PCC 7601]|nr:hypothetical protein FDUTEX481_05934 [Tolypothrix sp. PCC 7601]